MEQGDAHNVIELSKFSEVILTNARNKATEMTGQGQENRKEDVMNHLFIGDYGRTKTTSTSSKIYKTRILKYAKDSISADEKWAKQGIIIDKGNYRCKKHKLHEDG